MAGLGAKKFAANSLLSSTDVNGYFADQVIMKFANAAARDAAFGGAGEPTLAEGMFCYLDDTDSLLFYNGSAWVSYSNTFTNEAARDALITAPYEGMQAYLTAPTIPAAAGTVTNVPTGVLTIYNGTVWVCKTQVGANSAGTSSTFGTSYVDIGAAVTSVTLVTGTTALVSFAARINGTGNFAVLSVKTAAVAASDNWGAFNQTSSYVTVGRTFVMSGLTAGTNTFTCQAKSNVASGNLDQLSIAVEGIV